MGDPIPLKREALLENDTATFVTRFGCSNSVWSKELLAYRNFSCYHPTKIAAVWLI